MTPLTIRAGGVSNQMSFYPSIAVRFPIQQNENPDIPTKKVLSGAFQCIGKTPVHKAQAFLKKEENYDNENKE